MQKKILLNVLVFLFSFLCFNISAQQYPFNKWDSTTLEKANTAKDVDYMTKDEKKVIFYTNLVRLKPELFSETYLQQYLDSLQTDSLEYKKESAYIVSLQRDLKRS